MARETGAIPQLRGKIVRRLVDIHADPGDRREFLALTGFRFHQHASDFSCAKIDVVRRLDRRLESGLLSNRRRHRLRRPVR